MENTAGILKRMDRSSKMTAAAGLGAIVWGLGRKSLLGKLLGIVPGVYLGAKAYAASNGESVGDLVARARTSTWQDSVIIERSPAEVYAYVRDFSNMPQFMTHTHDVREDDAGRIHWVLKASRGVKLEYDGVIVDDEPGTVLTYRSAPEEPFEETGTLLFEPAGDDATRLTMRIAWKFPSGPGAMVISKALVPWTDRVIGEELENLKRALEVREGSVLSGATS